MLPRARDYQTVYDQFSWPEPEPFNVADLCCTRHDPAALALIHEGPTGAVRRYAFGDLERAANRFAHALAALGVARGAVVALHLPQLPETVIAHLAIQKLGAVALPLFTLFGPDALAYRFSDARPHVVLTTGSALAVLEGTLSETDAVAHFIVVDDTGAGGISGAVPDRVEGRPAHGFDQLCAAAASDLIAANTTLSDPAYLLYTSGTTGNPKGVLHAQSVLLGHLPGIILPHAFFPQDGDRFWTPADWAWAGGLFDCLLPALYFGVPVVAAHGRRFDPLWAADFMARHGVRNSFIPPTALRMMQQANVRAKAPTRTIASGGEKLGEGVLAWGREAFDLSINEFYGQTEVNLVIGNCADLFEPREGSMGKAIPGHDVAIVRDDGTVCAAGESGVVAVRRPDPVMFIEYWNQAEATQAKFRGDWCLLGDVATCDEDGYFWFAGRDDDIIITSGYRVGPTEVEDCLVSHPAVALAGVIGTPDALRGEVITAFVQLADGVTDHDGLTGDIQDYVRARLAAHEYPRHIHVLDALPLTLTGKLRRKDLREMAARLTDPR